MLIAIDPGVQESAMCVGTDGQILRLAAVPRGNEYVRSSNYGLTCCRETCPGTGTVVIERPHIHAGTKDPDDIVELAIVVGQLAQFAYSAGCEVVLVRPRDWKGTTPKHKHHRRVWEALSEYERRVVASHLGRSQTDILSYIVRACEADSRKMPIRYSRKDHNYLDAVALWLTHAKRI